MRLDNALRSALVREGEAIPADAAAALPGIARRVRAQRRQRVVDGLAGALALAVVVWVPSGSMTTTEDAEPPPAHERPAEVPAERSREAGRGTSETGPSMGPAPAEAGTEVRPGERRGGTPAEAEAEAGSRRRDRPAVVEPALPSARQLVERYEVGYVAGTHVGENAGTGCSAEASTTGANDCIAIAVADDESEILLALADDRGVVVGATVYQHVRGEGRELVSFCGTTNDYVAVEPGALLLVYVDTSSRCSADRPGTGTLTATIR